MPTFIDYGIRASPGSWEADLSSFVNAGQAVTLTTSASYGLPAAGRTAGSFRFKGDDGSGSIPYNRIVTGFRFALTAFAVQQGQTNGEAQLWVNGAPASGAIMFSAVTGSPIVLSQDVAYTLGPGVIDTTTLEWRIVYDSGAALAIGGYGFLVHTQVLIDLEATFPVGLNLNGSEPSEKQIGGSWGVVF